MADLGAAIDAIGYAGPIMMECIRALRRDVSGYRPDVIRPLTSAASGPP